MNVIKSAIFLILPLLLLAADVTSFTSTTDKNRVDVGGTAIIEAELISNKPLDISRPPLAPSDSYRVVQVGGSSRQTMQNFNGRQQRSFHYIFQYRVRFGEAGTTVIPPITVNVDNQEYSTESLTYAVGDNVEAVAESPVTVSFQRAKSTVYVNEQLQLTLRILQKENTNAQITNEGFHQILDTLNNQLGDKFSVTITTPEPEVSYEVVNGMRYKVIDLKLSLTGLDTGTVAISSIPFAYVVQRQVQSRNSFFAQVVNDERTGRTPRLTLSVVALPSAPSGYNGAVGRARLRSEISGDSVAVGDGITIKYTLTGRMKPASMDVISLPDMNDFEMFSPERRTVTDSSNGIFTKKETSYMLIPRSEGELTIPAVKVIWFDPTIGEYFTEVAGPFTITVTPNDEPVAETRRYLTREQIAMVGADIQYIKTELPESAQDLYPHKRMIFTVLLPLPWIFLVIAVLYKLSVKLAPKDTEKISRKGALGRAYRELGKIEKGKSKGSPAGVIEKYLLEKYKISAPSMRRDQLKVELVNAGAAEDAVDSILTFLDKVETSRYSGASSQESMISEAKKVLKQITKEVN